MDAGTAADEAITKEGEDVPVTEGQIALGGSGALLQLEAPEILTGEPIMPPPVDCCQFPIARFLHLDETTGPSPQHTLAEEREVVETGAEREVAPLSMGE